VPRNATRWCRRYPEEHKGKDDDGLEYANPGKIKLKASQKISSQPVRCRLSGTPLGVTLQGIPVSLWIRYFIACLVR
jgi:hypothetical protein